MARIACFFVLFMLSMSSWAQKDYAIEDRMLIYQLPNGGWPKQYTNGKAVDYKKEITPELKKIIAVESKFATIDNNATTREIIALARAYNKSGNELYKTAVEKGILYLLSSQYANGGFPQFYPDISGYRSQITYNDHAMINVLLVLNDVVEGKSDFSFIQKDIVLRAETAVAKGVDCILNTQYKQGETLTIWAAQYDEKTLKPAQARNFEPASLATAESVGIVRFLMSQKPTPAIIKAVESAIAWFEKHDIEGFAYKLNRSDNVITKRYIVEDPNSVIWARFYDLENNRPVFGDRDKSVTYNYDDVSEERKNGYAWYGEWPDKLIKENYPKWLVKIQKNKEN